MFHKHTLMISLFFATLSTGNPVAIAQPCSSLNHNSCWHTVNQSNETASLKCKLPYNSYFSVNGLEPSDLYSKQFNRSWGDGLGFPEPGKPVLCSLTTNNSNRQIGFSTFGWGGRVKIYITPDLELEVHQKDGWSDRIKVIRSDD